MKEITDQDISTFSIGTTDPSMNELFRARTISKLFNTTHHEFIVEPDAIDILPKLVSHFGQPFADSSAIPAYYVSSMARQHVKVALSGDGGDEMFAGYDRYRIARLLQIVRNLSSPIKRSISNITKLSKNVPVNKISRRLGYLEKLMKLEELKAFSESYLQGFISTRSLLYRPYFNELLSQENALDLIANNYSSSDGHTLLDRWINADLLTMLPGDYLTKVDIASMASSLEVRVPFLDSTLASFTARIPSSVKLPGGKSKALLKSAFQGILPDDTLDHRKTGFTVPVHLWLRNELAIYVDKLLLESKSELFELFLDFNFVKEVVLAQRAGDNSQTTRVWGLLILVIWEKMFITNQMSTRQTLLDII